VVDVVALRREGMPGFEVLDRVNVHRIQSRQINERSQLAYLLRILQFLIHSAFVLTKKHLSKPYDVVHVHSVPDFLVFGAAVPKLLGARLILDIHDILPEFYASKFGAGSSSLIFKTLVRVEKLSIAFCDHVIIANDLWWDRLTSRSVKPAKCTAFVNYPDPEVFYPRAKVHANNRFLILYPGTLNTHQGVDIAIRAFAQVADKMPEAEFHVYGEGPAKDSLMRLRAELGLSERVILHDFLSVPEIAEVMAKADLAVVAKRASSLFGNEAASTKILEFMSLGVPVIASRTRIDTYYHDDSMIRFFESENELELAQAILELRNDAKLREKLTANASRYVQEHNWREKSQEYLRLVDAVAAKNSVSGRGRKHAKRVPRTTE
jgi:glycosyltransferase involved in cell wall biosynthesis